MQPDNKIILYLKGNGSSYCLLNAKKEDSDQFLKHQFSIDHDTLKSISVGGYFIIAIFSEQQVWIWGELGTKNLLQETKLCFNRKIMQVSCGWQHALFLSEEGKVLGLGSNKNNQLSIINPQTQKELKQFYYDPVELGLLNCQHICAGFRQSYIIEKQGKIRGCGQSKNYQLGANSKKCQWIQIDDETKIGKNVQKIVTAKKFMLILTKQGRVFGLGSNQHNSFNQKDPQKSKVLQKLTLIFPKDEEQQKYYGKITDIQCGWNHLILQNDANQIFTFGRNNFGQLGRKNQGQNFEVKLPQPPNTLKVKSGSEFSFALSDGKLYGWGWNQHCNIVNNKQFNIYEPTLVETDVKNVWTGSAITIIQKNH